MAKLKKLAVRVMYNNSETEYDYNSDAATINITPLFKAELFALRNEVIKLKKLNSSIYDIRVFDRTPTFLAVGEFDEVTNDVHNLYQKEVVKLTNSEYNELEKRETVRTDVVLLQISEDGFFWTGLYKHTEIRFMTSKISFTDI